MTQKKSISFPCITIQQPIGKFFLGAIGCQGLCELTWFDVRRIEKERDVETYLGIQRQLSQRRVKEIASYVRTVDACFPTAVILAVPGECAEYNEEAKVLTLSESVDAEGRDIPFGKIAKVLDGQHRIEGLRDYSETLFEINVSIFIDIDIAEQAYIFSTVNLAQTKVNKSLVYDLFDLAKSRSPQKICHNIAVALDSHEGSPFYKRIKRLGHATEGRFSETITQATFVQALLRYLTNSELTDRDTYLRGKTPKNVEGKELLEVPFRNMMIEQRDNEITDIVWNYFGAVRNKWPEAWSASGRGSVLNKTNGFRGLMRFLSFAYLDLVEPGGVPSVDEFDTVFEGINISDDFFNTDNFKPGTSGEAEIFRVLCEQRRLRLK